MKQIASLLLGTVMGFGFALGQTSGLNSGPVSFSLKKSERDFKIGEPSKVCLRLAEVRSFSNKDNARVTLNVQMDWGDNSGYQLLLDAEHDTYGAVIPAEGPLCTGEAPEGLYEDNFEYKLPLDASAVFEDYAVVGAGESQSIEIPAGIYDYCVVNPSPENPENEAAIWIASGTAGKGDDVEFLAGSEYVFVIEEFNEGDYCTMQYVPGIDVAVKSIEAPVSGESLTSSEKVRVVVENRGAQDLSGISLSYTVNGKNPVTELVEETLAAGQSMAYDFKSLADLSLKGVFYTIEVAATVFGDVAEENDTMRTVVFHEGPIQPPFICNFDMESDMDLWNILNPDNDVTWQWNEVGSNVEILYDFNNPLNDYLVTKYPVHLKPGTAYIVFDYNAYATYPESMAVLYGQSAEPVEMAEIGRMEGFVAGGNPYFLKELEIEEEGDYYFALYAFSEALMYGIYVDNLEIGEGRYPAHPDLELLEVVLPGSGCDLSAESPVQIHVANRGRADILSYEMSYSVNGEKSSRQTFGLLKTGKDTVITFAEAADLSVAGTSYEVSVTGFVLESSSAEEVVLDNNRGVGITTNYEPLPLPYVTDFSDTAQTGNWISENHWYWDPTWGGYVSDASHAPLVSRCVVLEEGETYRFAMEYKPGATLWGMPLPETFTIRMGLSGTDRSEWHIIWTDTGVYETEFISGDTTFLCEQAGNYAFEISSTNLFIKNIKVEEVLDYDLSLTSFSLPWAYRMPIDQMAGIHTAGTSVQNRGGLPVEAKVEVWHDTVCLGSDTVIMNLLDEIASSQIAFRLPDLKPGDSIRLMATTWILEHADEDKTADNSRYIDVIVTDEEMGYDRVSDEMFANADDYVIGAETELAAGLVFTLIERDTLTDVAVGWGMPEDEPVWIRVYEWNAQDTCLGTLLYEMQGSTGTESGFVRYELPGLLLEPGEYMIAESTAGFMLMADRGEGGFYVLSNDKPIFQQNLGIPAIRAVFGHDAVVRAEDVAVKSILSPDGDGWFAANEKVEVEVQNVGYQKANASIGLWLNSVLVDTQAVRLEPYEIKSVVFEADLSQASTEYALMAVSRMEGDEYAGNDTAVKVVNSFAPANPYVMDFEYCQDFALSDFTPAWTTVDADGAIVGWWNNTAFALEQMTCGFVAFNPDKTEPSLLAELGDKIAPHGGKRYGASIFVYEDVNDDWLISPKLRLPSHGPKMEFYVKSFLDELGLERYNVLVSSTDNALESFSVIGSTREAPVTWTKVEVDLSEYAGQEVYLAIQCVSEDNFMFMIDDIKVYEPTGNEGVAGLDTGLTLYPNPADDKVWIRSTVGIRQVSILNMAGVLLYSSAENLNQAEFRYDVSTLPSGLYYARVLTDYGFSLLKFLVR